MIGEKEKDAKAVKRRRRFTSFTSIVFNGDIEDMRKRQFDQAEIYEESNTGKTALFFAARLGKDDMVNFLLDHGADPSRSDAGGSTPFLEGAEQLPLATMQRMLSPAVDINAANSWGWTALHKACAKKNFDVAKWLVSLGANPDAKTQNGVSPRTMILSSGRLDILSDEHGEVSAEDRVGAATAALYSAIRECSLEGMKTALDAGADMLAPDSRGYSWSALDAAVFRKFKEGIVLLKERGMDLDFIPDKKKKGVLHEACRTRNQEMVEFLLENGASPNVKDGKSLTPMHYLVRKRMRMVENRGFTSNVASTLPEDQVTVDNPVFVECMRALLKAGGDPSIKSGATGKGASVFADLAKNGGDSMKAWLEAESMLVKSKVSDSAVVSRRRSM